MERDGKKPLTSICGTQRMVLPGMIGLDFFLGHGWDHFLFTGAVTTSFFFSFVSIYGRGDLDCTIHPVHSSLLGPSNTSDTYTLFLHEIH